MITWMYIYIFMVKWCLCRDFWFKQHNYQGFAGLYLNFGVCVFSCVYLYMTHIIIYGFRYYRARIKRFLLFAVCVHSFRYCIYKFHMNWQEANKTQQMCMQILHIDSTTLRELRLNWMCNDVRLKQCYCCRIYVFFRLWWICMCVII